MLNSILRSRGKTAGAIFLLALALRLVYLLQVRHTPVLDFLCIDADYYHKWAASIAAGDIMGGAQVFTMAPFYAYFLAVIYRVAGAHFMPALVVQILIGSLSCILIFRIAQKYFNDRAALFAGLIAAVYPVFIFYDATLLKENLMVFFLLLFVLLYDEKRPWKLALAGVCIGVNALMRPTIFLALPFLIGYEYFKNRDAWLLKTLLIAAGITVTVFPVALRNRVVGGNWVLTVASGGMNFWTGNNTLATGAYIGAPFITSEEPEYEREDFRREASKRAGKELTVKGASDYWYSEGLRFISGHPRQFMWLLWRKFIMFWHNTELPSDLNFYLARDFSGLLQNDPLTFGIVVPFAVLGILLAWKLTPANFLLLTLAGTNLLASFIFFNSSRYRLPVVPVFILYAGFAAAEFLKFYQEGNSRGLKLLLLAVPLYLCVNYRDPVMARISWTRVSYLNAATYYMQAAAYDKAEQMLQKCLTIDPQYPLGLQKYAELQSLRGRQEEARQYMAQAVRYAGETGDRRALKAMPEEGKAYILFQQKRYAEALALFRDMLAKQPEKEKELSNAIGLCYLRLGDYPNAEKTLTGLLARHPEYDKACYNLGVLYKRSGDRAKADEYFRKTLEINPAYEKARQQLQQ
jgi:tetratricopeptide (TPR) repeat protein